MKPSRYNKLAAIFFVLFCGSKTGLSATRFLFGDGVGALEAFVFGLVCLFAVIVLFMGKHKKAIAAVPPMLIAMLLGQFLLFGEMRGSLYYDSWFTSMNSFYDTILPITYIFSLGLLGYLAFVLLEKEDCEKQERVRKLWRFPALIQVVVLVGYLLYAFFVPVSGYDRHYLERYFYETHLTEMALFGFAQVTYIGASYFFAKWMAFPYVKAKQPKPKAQPYYDASTQEFEVHRGEGYVSMTKHVLLLLFSFGIWQYIWIYRTTRYLNCVKGCAYRSPKKKLLLCIFVPFYTIYWTYKSAERIDLLAKQRRTSSDLATLCLILAILMGIIPPILMQSKINQLYEEKTSAQPSVAYVSEELKGYKELLDQGIITAEEFESKKKQLLHI